MGFYYTPRRYIYPDRQDELFDFLASLALIAIIFIDVFAFTTRTTAFYPQTAQTEIQGLNTALRLQ